MGRYHFAWLVVADGLLAGDKAGGRAAGWLEMPVPILIPNKDEAKVSSGVPDSVFVSLLSRSSRLIYPPRPVR